MLDRSDCIELTSDWIELISDCIESISYKSTSKVDDCGDIKENTASFAPTRTPFLCDHCFSLKSEGRPLTPGRSGSLGRPFPIRDDAR